MIGKIKTDWVNLIYRAFGAILPLAAIMPGRFCQTSAAR